jgi:hypothetical protein
VAKFPPGLAPVRKKLTLDLVPGDLLVCGFSDQSEHRFARYTMISSIHQRTVDNSTDPIVLIRYAVMVSEIVLEHGEIQCRASAPIEWLVEDDGDEAG